MERIYINNELKKAQSDDFEIREFIDIEKAHVNSYTRTTKSGKMSNVNSFERKDAMRIQGIVDRAKGSKQQELRLTQLMAEKITDKAKAQRRGLAAEDENYHDMAKIFFDRAKFLGTGKSSPRIETSKTTMPEIKGIAKVEEDEVYDSDAPLKWKKEDTSLLSNDGKNEYEIYPIGNGKYVCSVNDVNKVKGTLAVCKGYAEDYKNGKFDLDEEAQAEQDDKEIEEQGKYEREKAKEYNTLLPKWNKIIADNAFDIQGALETFVKQNNLSKQETKDFFAKRSKNKGQHE